MAPQFLAGRAIERENEELVAFDTRQEDACFRQDRRLVAGGDRGLPRDVLLGSELRRKTRCFSNAGTVRSTKAGPVWRSRSPLRGDFAPPLA